MPNDLRDQLQKTLGTAITIDRELGGGGMSRVFVATDTALDRQVVVKMLPPEAVPTASLERFHREIRTAAKLQHPHIVPVLSAGDSEGLPYYTMPFVPGESLRQRLSKGGELSVHETVHILRDVAAALAYAHAEGVVHRDIKPENVMLSGGVAVVTDFGVAKALNVAATVGGHVEGALTSMGVALGTPAYMSPEQATADPHVDHRSDIYSFGCVAYEMLAGTGIFSGRTPPQMLAAHVQETPEPLQKRRPAVPAALSALVMRCLEKRPGDRPQSAQELLSALDAIATPSGGMAPTEARLQAVKSGKTRWALYAGIGVVAVAAVGAFFATRAPTPVRFSQQLPIANSAAIEIAPAISPDGKFVAYAADSAGRFKIYVKQIAGGRPTPLASEVEGNQVIPRWSPDGSQILFVANGMVYVVPAFGGVPHRLFGSQTDVAVADASFSPDGKTIAYGAGPSLWLRNADGRSPRQLATGASPFHSIAWSSDGRLIAFVEGNIPSLANVSAGTVWVTPADKGDRHKVSNEAANNMSPAFLPDGSLLYISNMDGAPDVYEQPLRSDGRPRGQPMRLTTGLFARTISVSANGTKLAYDVVRNRSHLWSVSIAPNGAGSWGSARQVTTENERIEGMRLSHDGMWLTYDADRGTGSDIYKLKLEGGSPVQLTTNPGNDFFPSWSADDREILFYSSRNGNRDVFTMSAENGAETVVTSGPRQDYYPDWSPDGRKIVFGGGDSTFRGLYLVQRLAEGGWSSARKLGPGVLDFQYFTAGARWSPDGRQLVASSGDVRRLVVTDTTGAVLRTVWTPPANGELLRSYVWARDGTIYFSTMTPADSRYSIWSVSANGGAPRLILRDTPEHPFSRWDFDTDGKRLFVNIAADESDVWVVDIKR